MGETFGEQFSRLAGLMIIWGAIQNFVPDILRLYMEKKWAKLMNFFYPYVYMTFHEYNGGTQNEAYSFIRAYLGAKSTKQATRLTAEKSGNSKSLAISLADGEEIIDEFKGVRVQWLSSKEWIQDASSSRRLTSIPQEKKSYVLSFRKKHRDTVIGPYMEHVMEEGKAIELNNRKRKLYTNKNSGDCYWDGGKWSHINFKHPATFETLAMDHEKKQEIINDLTAFTHGKDYYAKIGKAWKRGYLLHGPPGTGKSTMIAAIANFLEYDIYDLELTSVNNNAELKKLLIDTRSKSVIVIEDIDCSLDLTGKRNKMGSSKKVEEKDSTSEEEEDKNTKESKVTLSGLLNFIDGIWSACGQERIIIFTTNHVNKLDPALIRRGRMDMHIEMSYCKFEAFKVLAKNYLDIDSHPLFGEIRHLLEETSMSPCDVAENLMPKTDSKDAQYCLMNLIQAIKAAKEKERLEGEKDAKTKKLKANLLFKFTSFKKSAKLQRKSN